MEYYRIEAAPGTDDGAGTDALIGDESNPGVIMGGKRADNVP